MIKLIEKREVSNIIANILLLKSSAFRREYAWGKITNIVQLIGNVLYYQDLWTFQMSQNEQNEAKWGEHAHKLASILIQIVLLKWSVFFCIIIIP